LKSSQTNPAFVLAACIIFVLPAWSDGENASASSERWDLRMINEARINRARIWDNLLTHYGNSRHKETWPDRRAALQEVVAEHPYSQWADDAALLLACGRYEFEGDRDGAIRSLRAVAERYPDGHSIVDSSYWPIGEGCRLDAVWVHNQGSLVHLNPDGGIRKTSPYDRFGAMHPRDEGILAYFAHLERYPIYTKDVANLFIAWILINEKDRPGAVAALKTVIADANEMTRVARADRIGASEPNCYFVKGVYRPEYSAYTSLMLCYETLGDTEKAIATADACAAIVNQSHRYSMMCTLGRFYKRNGLRSKARAQYQRALQRIEGFIEAERKRSRSGQRNSSTDEQVPERYKRGLIGIQEELKGLADD